MASSSKTRTQVSKTDPSPKTTLSRESILISEAKKWLGVTEKGGNNKGPEVEAFQRAVDGKAQGEPWCMSFVQFCLIKTGGDLIARSEHCLTVWNRTDKAQRIPEPRSGCLMIWRHKGSDQGHVAIVEFTGLDGIHTIEGNTAPHRREVTREGDGVYQLIRSPKGEGTMEVVGYLWPWKETA